MHRGDVNMVKIALEDNLADPFTKTLLERVFDEPAWNRSYRHVLSALGQVVNSSN